MKRYFFVLLLSMNFSLMGQKISISNNGVSIIGLGDTIKQFNSTKILDGIISSKEGINTAFNEDFDYYIINDPLFFYNEGDIKYFVIATYKNKLNIIGLFIYIDSTQSEKIKMELNNLVGSMKLTSNSNITGSQNRKKSYWNMDGISILITEVELSTTNKLSFTFVENGITPWVN